MSGIDWEEINSKLPFKRTDEEKEQRKALFKQFDPNENGYLSLAEVSLRAINKQHNTICGNYDCSFLLHALQHIPI
jgi:Ca2+-binding EF-hand superfamily protein